MDKPPIGITPRYIWKSNRIRAITDAIIRYTEVLAEVPVEWVQEYNDLIKDKEKYNG